MLFTAFRIFDSISKVDKTFRNELPQPRSWVPTEDSPCQPSCRLLHSVLLHRRHL